MRLRRHRAPDPSGPTMRPAEPFLLAGAEEARRLGHKYVGTEHLLLILVRDRDGRATAILEHLGVTADAVENALSPWLAANPPSIDPDALATLGIDLAAVRERLDEVFGPAALERTRAGCLGVTARTKQALAHAVEYAAGGRFGDEHILLGILRVSDCVAAEALGTLGIYFDTAEAIVRARPTR